jgi:hypothetical protein
VALLEKGTVVHENTDNENEHQQQQTTTVPIRTILLPDIAIPPASTTDQATASTGIQVIQMQGDVSQVDFSNSLYEKPSAISTYISVFHLVAVMSGDGERTKPFLYDRIATTSPASSLPIKGSALVIVTNHKYTLWAINFSIPFFHSSPSTITVWE